MKNPNDLNFRQWGVWSLQLLAPNAILLYFNSITVPLNLIILFALCITLMSLFGDLITI